MTCIGIDRPSSMQNAFGSSMAIRRRYPCNLPVPRPSLPTDSAAYSKASLSTRVYLFGTPFLRPLPFQPLALPVVARAGLAMRRLPVF